MKEICGHVNEKYDCFLQNERINLARVTLCCCFSVLEDASLIFFSVFSNLSVYLVEVEPLELRW